MKPCNLHIVKHGASIKSENKKMKIYFLWLVVSYAIVQQKNGYLNFTENKCFSHRSKNPKMICL